MLRKLYTFAQGACSADNADALCNHELLLPGHLMTMIVKEKLYEMMYNARLAMQREFNLAKAKLGGGGSAAKGAASGSGSAAGGGSGNVLVERTTSRFYQKNLDRNGSSTGQRVATFLATGNLTSSSGLDLMQVSGYTIVAERLNMFRYMSHFQSVSFLSHYSLCG